MTALKERWGSFCLNWYSWNPLFY